MRADFVGAAPIAAGRRSWHRGVLKANVIFYTAHYLQKEARGLEQACEVAFIVSRPAKPETVLRKNLTVSTCDR